MKIILLNILCAMLCLPCFSQIITKRDKDYILEEKHYFKRNGVDLSTYAFDREDINLGLYNTVRLKNKATGTQIGGFVLLGTGLVFIASGIVAKNSYKSTQTNTPQAFVSDTIGEGLSQLTGVGIIVMGAIQLVITLPVFHSYGKKAAQRDLELQKTKELFKGY